MSFRNFIKQMIIVTTFISTISCMMHDPYTDEKKISKTTKYGIGGALAGVATGALVGQLSGKKNTQSTLTGALVGAGVGTVAGSGYGHYMDKQAQKLRAELRATGVKVKRVGNYIELIMPGDITFDSNQSSVRSDFYPVLNSIKQVLTEFNKTSLLVVGHTDNTGSDSLNNQLSEKRALSVAKYLSSQGVNQSRLKILGRGSSQPLAENTTVAGKALNRRVEIKIIPPAE